MLYNIVKFGEYISDEDYEEDANVNGSVIKVKINSVSRLRRMYKNLIENQDVLLRIKMANDGRIP